MAEIIRGEDLLKDERLKKKLKDHIEKNLLIGMPTETVYGLGGNSLSEKALRNIFKMKNRPVSDPIISHVYDVTQAFHQLYHINIFEKYLIYILSKNFWPGPLSIIAKAKKNLPSILTAHTHFCAVRLPNNEIAREIIKICNTPIAAPSANKFQHISPTNSLHVLQEFTKENVLIFDDGQCDIGIESTVIKIVKYREKERSCLFRKVNAGDGKITTDLEVTTDEEYEQENEQEMEKLRQCLNCTRGDSHLDIYFKLKNIFDEVEMGGEIYDAIMKYKNLYHYEILIYRRGRYTRDDIEKVLRDNPLLRDIKIDLYKKIKFEKLDIFQNGEDDEKVKEEVDKNEIELEELGEKKTNWGNYPNDVNVHNGENKKDSNTLEKCKGEESSSKNEVSPGLLLTHYSPFVSTYLIDLMVDIERNSNMKRERVYFHLNKCILLDVGNSFLTYQHNFLKYINISFDNLVKEVEQIKYVTKNFFLFLREAERLAIALEAQNILISIVRLKSRDEMSLSLFDRVFRSASGKIIKVHINEGGQLELFGC
ncbi:threonylcarbamoyl-AMP synthase, putative [Plasmodium ovale]|uniref:Threonylcarbamoyl-AMP synthase n=2 Tax=Plasmodium ovale TaxID=36330 RepID=A0A1A8X0V1_PLAOA|nr:threonylcarbamoyl-AMP synthase, putative (SUA5) [Plasmodium ovale curtisi]SBS97304.1 threonylcarbamoyl-AMP synthase, putative (SUA5) [Plasmodium ovale curtisi]SCP05965.1 threonylcarbamoyl-AMP synthase, putative [Plasmodium ovale]